MRMGKQMIRPACKDDAKALAKIKSRYVQALYRGYLSADYLKGLHDTYFLEQINGWLAGDMQVDVLEQDDEVAGFVAYGADPEDASYGFIYEAGIMPSGSWQERDMLLHSCLNKLASKYDVVRVNTVRDNFRARFLYEQYGFRADGTQFTQVIDGNELRIIRLVASTGNEKK